MPAPHHEGPHTADRRHSSVGEISDGLRQWYESCPCCMTQALPEVKQTPDEERAAATGAVSHPGVK